MNLEPSIFDDVDAAADEAVDAAGQAGIAAGRFAAHDAVAAWLARYSERGRPAGACALATGPS